MRSNEIYVLCDLEGVTNATGYATDVSPDAPDYEKARRWLTDDLKAAMSGAHEAGADHFTVYDMHFHGRNVLGDQIPFPCTLIGGKPEGSGMREGMAAMFMVGLHAMAENAKGVLPHTYNHEIKRIELNGMAVGEIGLEAAAAGSYGIPLALVVGDLEGCEEARALLGPIETVAVKWNNAEGKLVLRDANEVRKEIATAAFRAMSRAGSMRPLRISGHCELRVVCEGTAFRDRLVEKCGGEAAGPNEMLLRGQDVRSVYARFRKSQIRQ